ncbi:hypothetical protein [Cypionkella sinensis]|uniref:hypothetical protein n=1 Tax=Cypionkella sinensis TaxID=1756043 RepID=UPI0036320A46
MTDPTAPPPFLSETLDDLRALNSYVQPRILRRYQRCIATAQPFAVRSPWTGRMVQLSANRIITHHSISYLFDDCESPPFSVDAGALAAGFPLLQVRTGPHCWLIATGNPIVIESKLKAQPAVHRIDWSKRPQVLIGDRNFAHFIWNEYPALHAVGRDLAADLLCLHDPLLLLHASARKRPDLVLTHVDDANTLRGWSDRMTGFLGAQYLDAEAKAAAVAHFRKLGQQDAIIGPHPRLYVSLRFAPRSSLGQQDMITAVIIAFLSQWRQGSVVIDGFSMPEDFERPVYDDKRAAFVEREARSRDAAAAVIADLPMTMQGQIVDITGMRLTAAITTALSCDYYVCHSGTLQHKVGWFAEIPGFIHSNSTDIRFVARRWAGNQSHGSKIPAGPSPHLIRDVVGSWDGPISKRLRNSDYEITDLQALVSEMIADMRLHLDE